MKKIISFILVLCMLIGMVPAVSLMASAEAVSADTSWYDAAKAEFELDTPAELLGFANLVNAGTTFAGQTVRLTADVDLNPGWTASATAPTNVWASMQGKVFSGTFDGDGHTLSGVYLNCSGSCVGIFGGKPDGATVKDLILRNSYVDGNWDVGSIFGYTFGTCTIENVYSDAIVYSCAEAQLVGGLAGRLEAGATLKIKGSVYAGTVTHIDPTPTQGVNQNATRVGGLVGGVTTSNATLEIDSCAFYGTINANMWAIGGLVGVLAHDTAKLTIQNCISAGTVNTEGNNAAGSILGQKTAANAVLTVENCVYIKINDGGVMADFAIQGASFGDGAVEKSSLVGTVPASLTGFTATETYPLPTSNPALAADIKAPGIYVADTSWYSESGTSFEISTPEQLLGFASLINGGKTFKGKTVRLTADIDLNPGWTAGAEAPPMSGLTCETRPSAVPLTGASTPSRVCMSIRIWIASACSAASAREQRFGIW